jgi:hypothetical protein
MLIVAAFAMWNMGVAFLVGNIFGHVIEKRGIKIWLQRNAISDNVLKN